MDLGKDVDAWTDRLFSKAYKKFLSIDSTCVCNQDIRDIQQNSIEENKNNPSKNEEPRVPSESIWSKRTSIKLPPYVVVYPEHSETFLYQCEI